MPQIIITTEGPGSDDIGRERQHATLQDELRIVTRHGDHLPAQGIGRHRRQHVIEPNQPDGLH